MYWYNKEIQKKEIKKINEDGLENINNNSFDYNVIKKHVPEYNSSPNWKDELSIKLPPKKIKYKKE